MPYIKFLGFVLQFLFKLLFKATNQTAKSVRGDLVQLFILISRVGAKKAKEFLFAVPSMLEFAVQLVRNADKFAERSRLIALGAAAALSSIVGALLLSMLGSWSIQLLLVFSIPLLAVPLLISSTLALLTAAVLYIWLVIAVLDQVMADDPLYKSIRDQHLSPEAKDALRQIEQASNDEHGISTPNDHERGPLSHLIGSVSRQMEARGSLVDAADLERRLQEMKGKLSNSDGQTERLSQAADQSERVVASREQEAKGPAER